MALPSRVRSNDAFSLVEVILGVTILSIVLVAMGILTITSIRANQANINRLTAYFLAQEAVEGMRNMRDSNWLQNYDYNGGEGQNPFWEDGFSQDGYYTLSYRPDAELVFLRGVVPTPWVLSYHGVSIDPSSLPADMVFAYPTDPEYGFYVTEAHVPLNYSQETTPYRRYVAVVYDEQDRWFEVTAVVTWEERGETRQVEVSTELSNWRGGAV